MKLEGSLDAFSLPDIFQLLSFTKKSGGLHLAHDGADGVVFFTSGQVTGASADSARQPLARRIVGSGAVSDEALTAAVEAAGSGEALGVVRALLEAGAVDADLLRQAGREQATDAIFDLLRWRNGDFAFVLDEANPDDVGITLTVESVLAEAEARNASWASVSEVVPTPRTVLAMPVVLTAEPNVSREEWALLALVDGRRSVAELVDLTGSGQYAVVSTLAALVQRGLLETREDQAAGEQQDHVAVVLRRQALLAPLEQFTPVVVPAEPVADVRHEDVAADDVPAPATVTHDAPPADSDFGPDSVGQVAEAPSIDEHVEPELATATASVGAEQPEMLGGAHVPADVVPPRPEPFLPKRQAEFDESGGTPPAHPVVTAGGANVGEVLGATATAPDPAATSVIERDPNVNRSLMLRLIAGVRGL